MIHIVTDNASGISKELAEELGIKVIEIPITIGEMVYEGNNYISFSDILENMQSGVDIQTSQISPHTFKTEFEKLTQGEDEVIYISVSSKLSGTYNSAVLAVSMLENPEKVSVIDSLNALIGQSLLVQEAKKLVAKGLSRECIVEEVEKSKGKVHQYIVVDTLDYLYKRGRLSKTQYAIGNLLKMKIILKAEDGEIKVEAKERGQKRVLKWLETKYESDKENIDFTKALSLCFREDKDELEVESEVLREISTHDNIKIDISTILLLFTGETAYGLGYFIK